VALEASGVNRLNGTERKKKISGTEKKMCKQLTREDHTVEAPCTNLKQKQWKVGWKNLREGI
jgi:hypothetical protein